MVFYGRVIPRFIDQALRNKSITVHGNGKQTRSFLYVSDWVDATWKFLTINKGKIIGILAAKNLISQGYPFLEAIYSFLNWGDELYISDGYSNDGTFDILSKLLLKMDIPARPNFWRPKFQLFFFS